MSLGRKSKKKILAEKVDLDDSRKGRWRTFQREIFFTPHHGNPWCATNSTAKNLVVDRRKMTSCVITLVNLINSMDYLFDLYICLFFDLN